MKYGTTTVMTTRGHALSILANSKSDLAILLALHYLGKK